MSAFAKFDRVFIHTNGKQVFELAAPGSHERVGNVVSLGRSGKHVVAFDDEPTRMYPIHECFLHASKAPGCVPGLSDIPSTPTFTKGDWVAVWQHGIDKTFVTSPGPETTQIFGTVQSKRGDRISVMFDDDRKHITSFSTNLAQASTVVDPRILAVRAERLGELAAYSVAQYKTHRGMEGLGFNANIWRSGRKIIQVLDEGSGGCCHYHGERAEIDRFSQLCKDHCERTGLKDASECSDLVVNWMANHRPNGETWAEFVSDWNVSLAQIYDQLVLTNGGDAGRKAPDAKPIPSPSEDKSSPSPSLTLDDLTDKQLADMVRHSLYVKGTRFGSDPSTARFLLVLAVPYGPDDHVETVSDAIQGFALLLQDDDWKSREFQIYDHQASQGFFAASMDEVESET